MIEMGMGHQRRRGPCSRLRRPRLSLLPRAAVGKEFVGVSRTVVKFSTREALLSES
jgi:hypothetical protein